jgi:hypothetical protein
VGTVEDGLMTREPDASSSDDELYAWFVDAITCGPGQVARELRDGVIEVVLREEPEPADADVVVSERERRVELLFTRAQLRKAAWSREDIFDDREPVGRPARNPVLAGLKALTLYVDEALGTLRPNEGYVVFHRGMFSGSVVPTTPPVRGNADLPDLPPGSGFWSAFPPGHPRFGEPGSALGP